jgi:predicted NBD/HSP70 family sugar kinase
MMMSGMQGGTMLKSKSRQRIITAKPQTVRRVNRAAVLELIRQHQPLSRADLARLTGIHRSNISIIVEELQSSGLLREERKRDAGRGRTPTLISLGKGTFGVIGVNLRRVNTTVAFASLDGHVESSYTFPTPESPEEFLRVLNEACQSVSRNLNSNDKPVRSTRQMVISIPGIVTRTGEHTSTLWMPGLPKYSGLDLAAMVKNKTGINCIAANNAGLGAVAALHTSQKQASWVNDFVFLVIGDVGVGSGLVIQRNLYSGHDATYAGEIGHTVINPNGPPCNCGRRGCLQLYVCDVATWKRYNPRLEYTSERFQLFLDEALKGNPKAVEAIRETSKYLSLGISNIALTLNPERIILAGALTRAWPLLEEELRSAFFLPQHHALLQPAMEPVDTLFIKGAIELALDVVLTQTAEHGDK